MAVALESLERDQINFVEEDNRQYMPITKSTIITREITA